MRSLGMLFAITMNFALTHLFTLITCGLVIQISLLDGGAKDSLYAMTFLSFIIAVSCMLGMFRISRRAASEWMAGPAEPPAISKVFATAGGHKDH